MYGVSSENSDAYCPNCHRVLSDLEDYADTIGNQGVYEDGSSPSFSTSGRGIDPGFAVVSFVWDWLANKFKQARLRRMYAKILPEYPRSLICASCLTVVRRR